MAASPRKLPATAPVRREPDLLSPSYPEQFLEHHVGRIIKSPDVAVIELVANAWDAGATRVDITWPAAPGDLFRITDDGVGMTEAQLRAHWLAMGPSHPLGKDRVVRFPGGGQSNRIPFGQNGKGRHAMFYFANRYTLKTKGEGEEVGRTAEVVKTHGQNPFEVRDITSGGRDSGGTELSAEAGMTVPVGAIREALSQRFVSDPSFQVYINGERVNLFDVDEADEMIIATFSGGDIRIGRIDSDVGARSTLGSGVAWWTNRRLVSGPSWEDDAGVKILDGRRKPARKITFIVQADMLQPHVLADWSGYDESQLVQEARAAAKEKIVRSLDNLLGSRAKEVRSSVLSSNRDQLRRLTPTQRESLMTTVRHVQEIAPKADATVLDAVVKALTTMKEAETGTALMHKIAEMDKVSIDDLVGLLDKWTVQQAKVVLDLVYQRLSLISELERCTSDPGVPEVQVLQPLFDQGLWIFGPEYESVEFTSNRSLLTVVRDLLRASTGEIENDADRL
ncbi:MAG: ATP-binding protein [Gemmatimonadales bacterium]|nr:ATP-binding protein [Gemmatimonadales bacterium]